MNNSPILKYALSLLVLSGTSFPLASIAGVWDYDSPKSVQQPVAKAAAPRSGLEGPIRTETMEPTRSKDARTINERGEIPQSSGNVSLGASAPAGQVGKETREFPYP